MDHYEKPKRAAQSEEDESFLFVAGLRVFQEKGLFVEENGLRLFKRNAVFLLVGSCLP
jgi:hypothetical protein